MSFTEVTQQPPNMLSGSGSYSGYLGFISFIMCFKWAICLYGFDRYVWGSGLWFENETTSVYPTRAVLSCPQEISHSKGLEVMKMCVALPESVIKRCVCVPGAEWTETFRYIVTGLFVGGELPSDTFKALYSLPVVLKLTCKLTCNRQAVMSWSSDCARGAVASSVARVCVCIECVCAHACMCKNVRWCNRWDQLLKFVTQI